MPTHLLSLDALLAILHSLGNGHMTGHMIEQGVTTSGSKKSTNEPNDLSSSAGIIFTTSASSGQDVTSSLTPMTSSELAGQKIAASKSLGASGGFRHSDSLPVMTLAEMKKISRSEEVVGGVAMGKGKSASGRQVGMAMCEEEGVAVDSEGGMELVVPSSKELLRVRQRKKVLILCEFGRLQMLHCD